MWALEKTWLSIIFLFFILFAKLYIVHIAEKCENFHIFFPPCFAFLLSFLTEPNECWAEGFLPPALKSVIGFGAETVRKLTHHRVKAVHFSETCFIVWAVADPQWKTQKKSGCQPKKSFDQVPGLSVSVVSQLSKGKKYGNYWLGLELSLG